MIWWSTLPNVHGLRHRLFLRLYRLRWWNSVPCSQQHWEASLLAGAIAHSTWHPAFVLHLLPKSSMDSLDSNYLFPCCIRPFLLRDCRILAGILPANALQPTWHICLSLRLLVLLAYCGPGRMPLSMATSSIDYVEAGSGLMGWLCIPLPLFDQLLVSPYPYRNHGTLWEAANSAHSTASLTVSIKDYWESDSCKCIVCKPMESIVLSWFSCTRQSTYASALHTSFGP